MGDLQTREQMLLGLGAERKADPPAGWKLVPVEARQLVRRIRERCDGKLDRLDTDLIDWLEREPDRLAAAPEPPAAPPDAMRERVRVLEGMLGSLRGYAASVWYDEAVASDEERDLMRRALAMLEPHHG